MRGKYLGYIFRSRGVTTESSIFDKVMCALPAKDSDDFLSSYFAPQSHADSAAHALHMAFPSLRGEAMKFLAAQTADEVVVAEFDCKQKAIEFKEKIDPQFADQAVVIEVREAFQYTHEERAKGYTDPFQVVASYSDIDVTASYIIAIATA